MMKKLFVIFALVFLLACAGSSEKTSSPKEAPAKREARKTPEKKEVPAPAPAEAAASEPASSGAYRKSPTPSEIPKAAAHNDKGLTLAGCVQQKNYSEISALLGSDVIFFGEVSYTGMDRAVFMRAVRTDNAQIVAAARIQL